MVFKIPKCMLESFMLKSVDKYEDIFLQFIANFRYNIPEKIDFKYLCKVKQLQRRSLIDFIKMWKKVANKLTASEQDLRDTFIHALLLVFKLEV